MIAFVLQLLLILLIEYVVKLEKDDPEKFSQIENIKDAWTLKKKKS